MSKKEIIANEVVENTVEVKEEVVMENTEVVTNEVVENTVEVKEENVMENKNNELVALLGTLTPEQIGELLKSQGLQVKKAKISYGHLNMIDSNHARCLHCKNEFEVDTTAENFNDLRKFGICPECLHKVLQAKEITSSIGKIGGTRQIKNGGKNVGEKFQALVRARNWTTEEIAAFSLKETSKQVFGLDYALFKDVTGLSDKEIVEARKVNGRGRYYAKTMQIEDKTYVICNHIYDKQLAMLETYVSNN